MTLSRCSLLTVLGSTLGGWLGQARIVEAKAWSLEDFRQSSQSDGPPKDGIPSID
jgi:hypothetical protein